MEMLRMPSEDHSRISFDANDYRLLRIEELRLSALTAAEKVKRTGAPFRFNPMNSRERRVIHLALRGETARAQRERRVRSAAAGGGLSGRHGQPARAAACFRRRGHSRSRTSRRPGGGRPAIGGRDAAVGRRAGGGVLARHRPDSAPRLTSACRRICFLNLNDTIVAISTPPGRGGLGVVRLSGAGARRSPAILHFARTCRTGGPGTRSSAELLDAHGHAVDQVVATFFAAPRSYTAEDVVEISCHGSPVVLRHAVERALEAGARLAEPGEFTLRAFLNGRIDLPQAEAVRDLIEATTLYQARIAAQQAGGSVSRRIAPLKEQLLELIALLEAGIDFAEDDVSVAPRRRDPAPPGADVEAASRALARQLPIWRAGARRPDAGHRGPAQRGQEQPVQPPAGAGPRHRDGNPRHHARPGFGDRRHRRHPGEAARHRRHPRSAGAGGIAGHRAQLPGHGGCGSDAGGDRRLAPRRMRRTRR